MDFIRRAWISIWAKKAKHFLLMLLIFIIFMFIFIGFAIQDATTKSLDSARKQLGADVSLVLNQKKLMEDAQNGKSIDSISPLSEEDVQKIATLKQVKEYQMIVDGSAMKGDLTPIKSSSKNSSDSGAMLETTDSSEMPSFVVEGVRESKLETDFVNKDSKLIEGEPITANDTEAAALIEKAFAEKNKLKVGDTFKLKNEKNKEVSFKVKGIYETSKTVDSQLAAFEIMNPANKIIVNYKAAEAFGSGGITSATYSLKDPNMINSFISDAQKLTTADDDGYYKFDAKDDAYEQLIGPIQQVGSFSSVIVAITMIAGGLILGLIVLLSIRERKFEMGVLMSLGESKAKIICQFLVEMLIVAVLAFTISVFVAGPAGQAVSDYMVDNQIEKSKEEKQSDQSSSMTFSLGEETTQKTYEPIDKINVELSTSVLQKVSLLGGLTILLATLIPSLFILRLKPKMLFAQKD
ncbi:ABC transporter permease [Listeria costaricensis]|uniref:ABC transporter permease n=1 Tax=Listeria costaricensis TaxID=2026604 RepID=UPI000C06CD4D|nr:ABC transporter permease [Listeria costaricensis]